MILQNLLFYKAFLILFKIKEGPQSISIAKVDFGAIFKMAASENRIYFNLYSSHRPSSCLNQHSQGTKIQWEHYLANSSFCQVLMAILVVFFKMAATENTKIYNFACD